MRDSFKKLVDAFPLKRGSPLLSQDYENGKTNLETGARGLGYLDADFSEHIINVYKSEGIAEIHLTLRTGERYYFGAVTFSGASRYPDTFFRRYLAFREGDVFSSCKADPDEEQPVQRRPLQGRLCPGRQGKGGGPYHSGLIRPHTLPRAAHQDRGRVRDRHGAARSSSSIRT